MSHGLNAYSCANKSDAQLSIYCARSASMMTSCDDAEAVESKRRRQSKRRKRLKMRAPPTASLEMLIYNGTNGIETTIAWKTELQYQAVAIFYKKMLGERTCRTREPGKAEFYCLENEQQVDAFWDFAGVLSKLPA